MTETLIAKPPGPAPSNIRLTNSTDSSLEISWDEVCDGVILYYSYVFQFDFETVQRGLSMTRTLTQQNLKCNTEYLFQIAAVNEVGQGTTSPQIRFTTNHSSGSQFTHMIDDYIQKWKSVKISF